MSLYVDPQVVVVPIGGSANFTLTETADDFGVPVFSGPSGQASFTYISGGAGQQVWSASALAPALASSTYTVTDPISGDTANFIVAIQPAALTNSSNSYYTDAGGYTATGIIHMIRLRANEPSLPIGADIIFMANAGLQEITRKTGVVRLVRSFPTNANQTIQALPNDINDVVAMSWSTGPVGAQGSLVYPMFQMPEGTFMDAAAGFPAVGFGPPVYWFTYQDQSGAMQIQMYPAAMVGQLNVYYRARPTFWTLTVNGMNYVSSNADPAIQETCVLYGVARVLEARGRGGEAAQIWQPQFEKSLEGNIDDAVRRTAPKTGQVRDTYGRGYPPSPWGW